MLYKTQKISMITFSIVGTIIYYILLFLFLILYFPLFVLARILFFVDKKQKMMHLITRLYCFMIIKLCPFWDITLKGREKMVEGQNYIVCSNHQSMFDIPLIGAVLPVIFKYVSKREVYKVPVIGWILWLRNDIGIERGGMKSAKKMLKLAKKYVSNGLSIVIFPEGTRTKTGKMNEFKEGAFIIAKSTSTPILPVVVDGTWTTTNYFGFGLKMPTNFTLTILDPISVEEVKKMNLSQLTEYTYNKINNVHRTLEPELYR